MFGVVGLFVDVVYEGVCLIIGLLLVLLGVIGLVVGVVIGVGEVVVLGLWLVLGLLVD